MAARPNPVAVVGAAILALAAMTTAQEPVFRAGVEQVRLDVAVTRGNRPVAGLAAADFDIRDNGVVQKVERVLQDDVPLRLLLVLDTSSSLQGDGLSALVLAAQSLVRALRPDDEVGLVTFSHALRLAVAPTPRRDDVLTALTSLRAGGATAWRDALFAGLHLVGAPDRARPAVLLFTDGKDNASWLETTAIDDVVRRSGVVLHAVGLSTRARAQRRDVLPRSLSLAIEAGGGRFWSADTPDELGQQFAAVLQEMRARYLVVYTLASAPTPGWHDVKVQLKNRRGEVRARPGYYVGSVP